MGWNNNLAGRVGPVANIGINSATSVRKLNQAPVSFKWSSTRLLSEAQAIGDHALTEQRVWPHATTKTATRATADVLLRE